MNQSYKQLTKNILKRLKLLVKVICEEDKITAVGLMSHAKSLVTKRTKLLSIIIRYNVSPKTHFMKAINVASPYKCSFFFVAIVKLILFFFPFINFFLHRRACNGRDFQLKFSDHIA